MDVASSCRDDPSGHRPAKPKGIAHSHDPITDLRYRAVTETHIRQWLVGIDFQHCDVRFGISADDLRRVLAVVLEGDLDLARVADYMIIRHNVTRRVDDEPRTQRDPSRLAFRHLRKRMLLPVGILLVKETTQHFIER